MRFPTRIPALVASLGLALTAACGGAKSAAEQALVAADSAVSAVVPMAEKIAPEELQALNAALASARDALAGGDFAAAATAAKDIPAKAQELAALVPERTSQLNADWQTLSADMPKNLAAVKDRLDDIARTRRMPEGVTADAVESAKATYAAASPAWEQAAAAFTAGDLAGAMTQALNLKTRVSEAMTALGLESGDRAWGNLMTPSK